jgi:hypothetical protein
MVSQATMSVVGHEIVSEIPLGKSSEDQILRHRIFNMVAPYFLSTESMEEVGAFSKREIDVWIQSFTNTQKGLHLKESFTPASFPMQRNGFAKIFSQRRDISFNIVREAA